MLKEDVHLRRAFSGQADHMSHVDLLFRTSLASSRRDACRDGKLQVDNSLSKCIGKLYPLSESMVALVRCLLLCCVMSSWMRLVLRRWPDCRTAMT